MAVIAWTGQSLRRNRALFAPRPGLQRVKQREADRLLELRVAVDLDVRVLPELVEKRALLLEKPVPAGLHGAGESRVDLVA